MKLTPKACLPMALGVFLLLTAPGEAQALLSWGTDDPSAAANQYTYEEKDSEAEKARYVVKLEQDKRKCELAIVNTKTLISRSKNRSYLPELNLRLAELYIEKSRLAFFLRKSQHADGGERALDQYEANMLKKPAIEIYQRILDNFPDFAYRDKVRFFMAHEYHELGQTEEMIKHYQQLIRQHPDSQYTPEAHLLLGDYYFNQKQDVDRSIKHYEAVLTYTKSPAVAAARYKLAWCKINLSDFKGALELFEASVTSPLVAKDLDIDTYRRVDVRLESLVDMAYCYPEVYKKVTAETALAYFKRYAWSRPVYTTALEKLAYRYYVKKKWSQSASIYRELAMIRQDPEKLLEYAKYIFDGVQAMGTYQHAEKDVAIIVRALEGQIYSPHAIRADKDKLVNDYEIYARDIITHLHAKANKSNSSRDYAIAADAYKQYLDFFVDSPAEKEMATNYAEALFSAGRYVAAGKQYEKIVPAATVDIKRRKETLYSAVISYYRALKEKDSLNFYQAAYARQGLSSAGKTYAGEYPKARNTPEVLFNVAWVAYDAGDYKLAIKDLSTFAGQYPQHKATVAAIHLVMDAYHLTEDYEGMIRFGNSVLADPGISDAALKQEIAQIVRGAESRVVSTITMAATDDWENTRQELFQVADNSGTSAIGEQALNALILSSKDQQDLATLFDAGSKLIQHYPSSTNVKPTLGVLIDTSVSIGQLRLLADYLELFGRRFPQHENAAAFMLQAARIREGLGQYSRSNHDYRSYLNRQSKLNAQDMDALVFAMADNALKTANANEVLKLLNTYQNRLSANGKARAYAQISVLNHAAGRRSQADKFGRRALKAYRPQMGSQDPLIRDLVAEVAYNKVVGASGPYFKLRLKNTIDNKIVEEKAKQLQALETGYQEVLAYKSPAWALKACLKAGEINSEFADFLLSAPVPQDLTTEQKGQYRDLIRQKAHVYTGKAEQYKKSWMDLARKWEICDPRLSADVYPSGGPRGGNHTRSSISGNQTCKEIGRQGLEAQATTDIYRALLNHPEDNQLQYKLAQFYLEQGDFRQAGLVIKNTLPKLNSSQGTLKANLLNLLGMTYLYCGEDPLAKETFKRALAADAHHTAARINLAGVLRHYGHDDKAAALMNMADPVEPVTDGVHPLFGAVYDAYRPQT